MVDIVVVTARMAKRKVEEEEGGGGGGRYRLQDALLRILAILKVKTKFHHGFAYYARSSEFADLPSRKLGEQQNTQDKTSHI